MDAMMRLRSAVSILSLLTLCACGGGGQGTPATTTVNGTTTPPATPAVGVNHGTPNMLVAPNSAGTWSSIAQSMSYFFDADAIASNTLKVNSLTIHPTDVASTSYTSITTGAAFPGDSSLGQPSIIDHGGWSNSGAIVSVGSLSGLPAVSLSTSNTVWVDGYVLPYSSTLNPSGYSYQTFATSIYWMASYFLEFYYSIGVVTDPTTLPAAGVATYSGRAVASFVDTSNREPYDAKSA